MGIDSRFLAPFQLDADEGQDKVVSLREAIERNVRPGMTIHLNKEAGALIRELSRQFWGTKPGFTIISYLISNLSLVPIYGRLAIKVLSTNISHIYPTPSPIKIIQQLYKDNQLQIESWSFCTLQQRLMAGAMGVAFLPTRSISGSSMAKENIDSFLEMDDPFGSGVKVGLLRALQPDISLIHGWAADRNGNTILLGPYDDSLWGPRASRNGVIVTVEKLVSTEFIRQHSYLVKLPGYLVKSVSVAPFGAHPWGMSNHGLPEIAAYKEDYDFMAELRRASNTPGAFDPWVKEWVLEPQTHESYLQKLGSQRINRLQELGQPQAWKKEIDKATISLEVPFTASEMMMIEAARQIQAKFIHHGYKAILAGIGVSAISAWLAYYLLRTQGHDAELMMGAGLGGYAPRPGEPIITGTVHFPSGRMLTDSTDMYGVMVGGENNHCISSLGAAQVDKYGNLNTTRVGRLYLIGSGGANDAGNSRETVAVARQVKDRFVENVDYITTPGQRVKTLVSQMGVFDKLDGNELTLIAVLPSPAFVSVAERIEMIKKNCSWELKVSSDVQEVAPPSDEEIGILRLLDPHCLFTAD